MKLTPKEVLNNVYNKFTLENVVKEIGGKFILEEYDDGVEINTYYLEGKGKIVKLNENGGLLLIFGNIYGRGIISERYGILYTVISLNDKKYNSLQESKLKGIVRFINEAKKNIVENIESINVKELELLLRDITSDLSLDSYQKLNNYGKKLSEILIPLEIIQREVTRIPRLSERKDKIKFNFKNLEDLPNEYIEWFIQNKNVSVIYYTRGHFFLRSERDISRKYKIRKLEDLDKYSCMQDSVKFNEQIVEEIIKIVKRDLELN